MEQQTKVLKLSNGEEIITVISHADKGRPYIEVKNPLQVNYILKLQIEDLWKVWHCHVG